MLLIILLGVITKLAVVNADCDIGTTNYSTKDWTNFTGTWYWLYHIPNKYNENLDCPVTTFDAVTKDLARMSTSVYIKRTKTRHRFVATVALSETYKDSDIHYSEPSSDIKCAGNETCTVIPEFTSAWSGKYRPLAADPKRYIIFEYCCKKLNTICFYVAFRTLHPDEETLNDVKKTLKENVLDINQLVKFETNHC